MHPNSPASDAGLCAHRDYIVGSDMMMNEDDFYSLVENSNHKELKLYVYNVDSDTCREVCVHECICEPFVRVYIRHGGST